MSNIIEIFPKAYIIEFELSFDPKEIVQKLNTYMSDTPTPSDEAIRIHVDYNNPLAGGIEIADGYSRAGSSHSPFGSILDQKEFEIDLPSQNISVEGEKIGFDIEPYRKERLIEGLDDIGITMNYEQSITDYELLQKKNKPWIFKDIK